MKNFLISGGCGFLGISLIKKLLIIGEKNIRVLDNLSVGNKDNLKKICNFKELKSSEINKSPIGVELIVGDILDEDLVIKLSDGCDTLIHLAANTGVGISVDNPRQDMLTNIIGTFNLLEASRKKKISRFIFASSGAPLGEVEPPIHEELAPHPVSPYGASKLACEGYCSAYSKTFGLETVILRFANVYGPGSMNKSSVVAKFIREALIGQTLEIYGDGNQTRDFIYVDDLIDAIILSIKSNKIKNETFQIATNNETTIKEILNIILSEFTKQGKKNINYKNVSIRPGDVKRNFSDISKAKNLLEWEPKVNLKDGISKTISYFVKYYKKHSYYE